MKQVDESEDDFEKWIQEVMQQLELILCFILAIPLGSGLALVVKVPSPARRSSSMER